jgi:hypothetical protein
VNLHAKPPCCFGGAELLVKSMVSFSDLSTGYAHAHCLFLHSPFRSKHPTARPTQGNEWNSDLRIYHRFCEKQTDDITTKNVGALRRTRMA